MKFVRYTVSLTDGRVVGVVQQDTPFASEDGGRVMIEGHECVTRDLGAVEIDHEARPDGSQRDVTMVLLRSHRLGVLESHHPELYAALDARSVNDDELAQHYHRAIAAANQRGERRIEGTLERTAFADLATGGEIAVHAVPCTMPALRDRVRRLGPQVIGPRVRAWLANVLPPDEVKAMGLGRGLPISAIKAAEALRARRDPTSGRARLAHYERVAQKRSDGHAAARLQARIEKAGAAKAPPAKPPRDVPAEVRAAIEAHVAKLQKGENRK